MYYNFNRIVLPDLKGKDEIFHQIPEYNSLWCYIDTTLSADIIRQIKKSDILILYKNEDLIVKFIPLEVELIKNIKNIPDFCQYSNLLINNRFNVIREISGLPIIWE